MSFYLKKEGHIEIAIYDIMGRNLETFSGEYYRGWHSFLLNLDLASGVYFYSLKTEREILTRKMVVIR